jgi:Concanavalin A-like lectin/glucanases superfamily
MNAHRVSNPLRTVLWCCAVLSCLQLGAFGATLTNRYSFTSDVSDSVGGRNGSLSNATISAGQAVLANPPPIASGDATGQYVDLPDNLVSNFTAITLEAWITPTHDDATPGAEWNRLWDFGTSDGTVGLASMWFRTGNSLNGLRGDIFGPGGANALGSAAILNNGVESHIVWTSDGTSQRGRIYVNGVVVAASDVFATTPASMGSTTNNWLGRSQFSADRYFDGSINEFRVYQGVLNPLQVEANFIAGPDAINGAPGTITGLSLSVATPLAVNSGAQAVLLAQASGLTNAVDIADSEIAVAFTSANTNVLTVTSNGVVTGKAAGTANVIATVGSVSATQAVTIIAVPTTMKHRYSFTADASDSVGTANGNLIGSATISAGEVSFPGNDTANSGYVDLPPYLIHPTNIINGAVTFEAWTTPSAVNRAWTRLFDFGDINTGSGNGRRYVFYAPNNAANGGQARVAVSDTDPGFAAEDGFNVATVLGQTNVHLLVVYNPNPARQFLGLYVNGNLVGSALTTKALSSLNNAFSFLGRSLYAGDGWLNGSINEFRIYDGELDRFQIAASFQSGPDTPNFNVGTFTSFNLNVGSANIPVSQARQLAAIMNFSAATNINVSGDGGLTVTSSDTNIVTVSSPAGVIEARALGTATLTGIYRYITGATTNLYTNSTVVTVVIPPANLLHRYSFSSSSGFTVLDSVGGANGTISSAAAGITNSSWTGGGQLTINTNTTLGAVDTYVDLPDFTLSSIGGNFTFELWVTDFNSGAWAQFVDFGSAPGQPNIFLNRQSGGQANRPRFDWTLNNISTPAANAMPGNVLTHLVALYDDTDDTAALYINGVRVGDSVVATLPVSSINDTNAWIGRSLYADPYVQASYDEFRIYSGLLTEAEIQKHTANGPNQLINDVGLSTAINGSNLVISWPAYGAHFTLQTSTALDASAVWSPVGGAVTQSGTNYRMSVPLTSTVQFYRMKRQW